jgi:hypothetical protein
MPHARARKSRLELDVQIIYFRRRNLLQRPIAERRQNIQLQQLGVALASAGADQSTALAVRLTAGQ